MHAETFAVVGFAVGDLLQLALVTTSPSFPYLGRIQPWWNYCAKYVHAHYLHHSLQPGTHLYNRVTWTPWNEWNQPRYKMAVRWFQPEPPRLRVCMASTDALPHWPFIMHDHITWLYYIVTTLPHQACWLPFFTKAGNVAAFETLTLYPTSNLTIGLQWITPKIATATRDVLLVVS